MQEGKIASALVIDTDAHQGDGTADAIRGWRGVSVLDFFEDDLFPHPKVPEDYAVPLPPGLDGSSYLDILRDNVPAVLDRHRPDLAIYNAGSDVLRSDLLSNLLLSPDDLAERDLFVFSEARDRGIPVAMVLSGGYGPLSWEAHARSIEGILVRFDRSRSSNP
jgi:histone deacetylase 11